MNVQHGCATPQAEWGTNPEKFTMNDASRGTNSQASGVPERETGLMRWLTHKFAPLILATSIMALAAFIGPIVELVLRAPVWAWGVFLCLSVIGCIVWLLRLEHQRMESIKNGEYL